MQARDKRISIAVVDYDACAHCVFHYTDSSEMTGKPNPHHHYLSGSLIADIRATNPVAFYGCTHRATHTVYAAAFEDERFQLGLRYHGNQFNPVHSLSTSITSNLGRALTIPCLGVSTPDDYAFVSTENPLGLCGQGYELFIKPYEEKLLHLNEHRIKALINTGFLLPDIPDVAIAVYNNDNLLSRTQVDGIKTKNTQLIMIARQVSEAFYDAHIDLFFYDDMMDICKNALAILPRELPRSISLHIHQHDAALQTTQYLGTVNSPQLLGNSLFYKRNALPDALAHLQAARLNPK